MERFAGLYEHNGDESLETLRGLPARMEEVSDDVSDEDYVVYRDFSAARGSCPIFGLGESIKMETVKPFSQAESTEFSKVTGNIFEASMTEKPATTFRYLDSAAPVAHTHVVLPIADSECMQLVELFVLRNAFHTEHSPDTNMWKCSTIVDGSYVQFTIRVLPSKKHTEQMIVEFRRMHGDTALAFRKVFDCFKYFSTGDPAYAVCNPTYPEMLSPIPDAADICKALDSLVDWLKHDPLEALQALGKLLLDKSEAVLRSAVVMTEVCRIVHSYHSRSVSDPRALIILSLAISCLRQYHVAAGEISSCAEMSAEHVHLITHGVARAAMSDCMTARREAVGLLLEMNPLFSAEIKRAIGYTEGIRERASVPIRVA